MLCSRTGKTPLTILAQNPDITPFKVVRSSGLDIVYGPLEKTPVTTLMLSWVRGLNQQVANLSFISYGPQVRILHSAPILFWVDMQTG